MVKSRIVHWWTITSSAIFLPIYHSEWSRSISLSTTQPENWLFHHKNTHMHMNQWKSLKTEHSLYKIQSFHGLCIQWCLLGQSAVWVWNSFQCFRCCSMFPSLEWCDEWGSWYLCIQLTLWAQWTSTEIQDSLYYFPEIQLQTLHWSRAIRKQPSPMEEREGGLMIASIPQNVQDLHERVHDSVWCFLLVCSRMRTLFSESQLENKYNGHIVHPINHW